MRMITCENGHYYDSQKHNSCPFCNNGAIDGITSETVVNNGGGDNGKTAIYDPNNRGIDRTKDTKPTGGETTMYIKKDKKSVNKQESILLSGWLVIISEQGRGTYYPLTYGMNTIGRETNNHISIENGDKSVSRNKHAIVIYDYQNNIFFIKHGDGQFLTYLNGNVLLDTKELKANDIIKVGDTELIFIPLCTNEFKWEN